MFREVLPELHTKSSDTKTTLLSRGFGLTMRNKDAGMKRKVRSHNENRQKHARKKTREKDEAHEDSGDVYFEGNPFFEKKKSVVFSESVNLLEAVCGCFANCLSEEKKVLLIQKNRKRLWVGLPASSQGWSRCQLCTSPVLSTRGEYADSHNGHRQSQQCRFQLERLGSYVDSWETASRCPWKEYNNPSFSHAAHKEWRVSPELSRWDCAGTLHSRTQIIPVFSFTLDVLGSIWRRTNTIHVGRITTHLEEPDRRLSHWRRRSEYQLDSDFRLISGVVSRSKWCSLCQSVRQCISVPRGVSHGALGALHPFCCKHLAAEHPMILGFWFNPWSQNKIQEEWIQVNRLHSFQGTGSWKGKKHPGTEDNDFWSGIIRSEGATGDPTCWTVPASRIIWRTFPLPPCCAILWPKMKEKNCCKARICRISLVFFGVWWGTWLCR